MLSPTLQKYIDYFNVMTSWVGTEILFAPTVDQRVITIKRFIQIAKKCYTLNNFNTAFEIVAGLQMVYISRLTETWKFVDKKKRSELEHLTKIFSPQSNYIAYREILSTKKEPINPYLALELRDISLIELHNESTLENAINFDKLRLLGGHLLYIKKLQVTPYVIPNDDLVQSYLSNLTVLSENLLWEYSNRISNFQEGNTSTTVTRGRSATISGRDNKNSPTMPFAK